MMLACGEGWQTGLRQSRVARSGLCGDSSNARFALTALTGDYVMGRESYHRMEDERLCRQEQALSKYCQSLESIICCVLTMSSRALRKLQREREEQEQANIESAESSELETVSRPVQNVFQTLNADQDEEDDTSDTAAEDEQGNMHMQEGSSQAAETLPAHPLKGQKKSKKKKKKSKAKVQNTQKKFKNEADIDEIDEALESLAVKQNGTVKSQGEVSTAQANSQLYSLLAVEAKHLIAVNEMKRLFGNVVLENSEEGAASPRRRGRGAQNLDLGTALTARHSPVSKGQGLKGLPLKRNPLVQGKEEWPQAASGGLGMELVEKMEDGTTEYRFTHSGLYPGLQREFEACVASMDPQRLVNMLIFNRE